MFAALVQVDAQSLGVTGETRGTLARVPSGDIFANGIVATLSGRSVNSIALIDVNASCCNITGVEGPSFFADAIRLNAIWLAVGMWATGNILARCFAFHTWWSANIARETFALKRSRSVDTLSIGSADTSSCSALIDIYTH